MWDERYAAEEYAYGTEPNQFLAEHFRAIPKGRVLSLAEGEWRATMTDEQVALWLGAHNTGSRPEGRP